MIFAFLAFGDVETDEPGLPVIFLDLSAWFAALLKRPFLNDVEVRFPTWGSVIAITNCKIAKARYTFMQ